MCACDETPVLHNVHVVLIGEELRVDGGRDGRRSAERGRAQRGVLGARHARVCAVVREPATVSSARA